MSLNRIVVAMDNSAASLHAARLAVGLAAASGAAVLAISVAEPAHRDEQQIRLTALRRLMAPVLEGTAAPVPVEYIVAFGLPQIEICRLAEQRHADLLVLGRKSRSRTARLLLGDTADAVVRRSRVPCLHVPEATTRLSRMLVALDGWPRSEVMFRQVVDLVEAAGIQLEVITVEPRFAGEPTDLAGQVPTARTERLTQMLTEPRTGTGTGPAEPAVVPLRVRHGDPVEQIQAEIRETGADILAIGFHRGGPAMVVETVSIARHLLHSSPCAVLTMPL